MAQVHAKVDPGSPLLAIMAVLSYLDLKYSRYYWSLFNRATCVWSHNLVPYKRSSYPALLQSFDAHNALIRDTVSEGRLLEFHPSQSWEPLCDFLGLPVPGKEFPRVNDGDYFVEYHRSLYWERWRSVGRKMIRIFSLAGLGLGLSWWAGG